MTEPERKKVRQTVVFELPPVYDRIVEAIGKPPDGTAYTYGDKVYSPGGPISDDVRIHEAVHALQQEEIGGPAAWWDRYLIDPEWRLGQELAAYRTQYAYFCSVVKDRNDRARFRRSLASYLSNEMYGKIMTFQDAYNKIEQP